MDMERSAKVRRLRWRVPAKTDDMQADPFPELTPAGKAEAARVTEAGTKAGDDALDPEGDDDPDAGDNDGTAVA
jgi:hypothetical protein